MDGSMFADWQAFYQTTAEAAATLTGLLFVVVTLTAGRQRSTMSQGVRLYTSPTVAHLASVLVISLLGLAPERTGLSMRLAMTAWSAAGLLYAFGVAVGLRRFESPSHWSDFWWYGFGPTGAYLVLVAAAGAACASRPPAAYGLALGLLVLLLIAVRNAWDLATWLAHSRAD